jgi:hypothetical protein
MKVRVVLVGALLVLLGSSVVWAGDPWKEKPYTSWTEDDISKILSDSPWSKPIWMLRGSLVVNLGKGSEIGGVQVLSDGSRHIFVTPSRLPDSSGLVTRRRAFDAVWISSLTVREALVRRAILEGRATIEQGDKILATTQSSYVIAVQSRIARMMLLDISKERLMELVYLELGSSRRRILPIEVMKGYETTSGQLSEVRFIFPRELNGQPTISAEEKEVKLCIISVPKPIHATFHLRKMSRNGKPDQ